MKLNWRALVGVLLVVMGVLAMLQSLNVFTFQGGVWLWIFAVIFAVVGLGFLYVLITAPTQNWWAAIPGFTLLGLGTMMILLGVPEIKGDWPVSIFMGSIGLSFIVVFLLDRSRWWAIIPAGVLLTLGVVSVLDELTEIDTGGVLFLGEMLGQHIQLGKAVGRGPARDGSLHQSLRDQIGVSAIWGGGMGIVLDRETKVPWGRVAWNFCHVFTRAQELDHRQG